MFMFVISIAAPQSISGTLPYAQSVFYGQVISSTFSNHLIIVTLCTEYVHHLVFALTANHLYPRIKDRDLVYFPGFSVPGTWMMDLAGIWLGLANWPA
jgi:hypothetical protein